MKTLRVFTWNFVPAYYITYVMGLAVHAVWEYFGNSTNIRNSNSISISISSIRIIGSEVKYVHFQSTSILDFRLKTDLHSKEPVHELVCWLHNARCTSKHIWKNVAIYKGMHDFEFGFEFGFMLQKIMRQTDLTNSTFHPSTVKWISRLIRTHREMHTHTSIQNGLHILISRIFYTSAFDLLCNWAQQFIRHGLHCTTNDSINFIRIFRCRTFILHFNGFIRQLSKW